MRWFGDAWAGSICTTAEHAATPCDCPCESCKGPILASDRGLLIPQVTSPLFPTRRAVRLEERPWHLTCFLREMGIFGFSSMASPTVAMDMDWTCVHCGHQYEKGQRVSAKMMCTMCGKDLF